jgi:hypothetical protein
MSPHTGHPGIREQLVANARLLSEAVHVSVSIQIVEQRPERELVRAEGEDSGPAVQKDAAHEFAAGDREVGDERIEIAVYVDVGELNEIPAERRISERLIRVRERRVAVVEIDLRGLAGAADTGA